MKQDYLHRKETMRNHKHIHRQKIPLVMPLFIQ